MAKIQRTEDFMAAIIGRPVIIKLYNGDIVKGILVSIDSMFKVHIIQ